jgi:polyhydroxybutyrate depolymerase
MFTTAIMLSHTFLLYSSIILLLCSSVQVESKRTIHDNSIIEKFNPSIDYSELKPGVNLFNLTRPEGIRNFYIYIPQSYIDNPKRSISLIFNYHGINDACEDYGPAAGFEQLSDKYGFLYVFPCGSWGWTGLGWNAGMCCLLDRPDVDDIAFTLAMVKFITGNFNVNSSQIFVTGFSNGALMAETLACTNPHIFRAAASASGVVQMKPGNAGGLSACTTAFNSFAKPQRISILNIHGALDYVVPYIGDPILGFPNIPLNMEDWASRNGCAANKTISTINNEPFSNIIWEDCRSNVRVELVVDSTGWHQWFHTSQFNATQYIYQFFMNAAALNY